MYPTHHIVANRSDIYWLIDDIDSREFESNLSDTSQYFLNAVRSKMSQIQFQTICSRFVPEASTLADLRNHGTGYYVTRCKLEHFRCILLHKSFSLIVYQIATLPSCTFCYQYARWQYTSWMELHKFHIL